MSMLERNGEYLSLTLEIDALTAAEVQAVAQALIDHGETVGYELVEELEELTAPTKTCAICNDPYYATYADPDPIDLCQYHYDQLAR